MDRETWDAVQAIIKEYSHSKFLTNPRRENGHSSTLLGDLKKYEEEEREAQTLIQKAQTYQTTKKLTPEEVIVYSADMDQLLHSSPADVSAALRYLLISVHLDRDKTTAYVNVNYRLLEDDLKKKL